MKLSVRRILFTGILALGAHALLVAQSSNTWAEQWYRAKYGRPSPAEEARLQAAMMRATDDQRAALAKCMEATEGVRQTEREITRKHRPYSRSHVIYNLNTVSEHKEQFEAALSNLTAAHQEFRNVLTEAQDSILEKHLRKLDHLQAELNSQIAKIDHGLMVARPDSLDISWNLDIIVRATNGWRSEHRKIAKELGIPK